MKTPEDDAHDCARYLAGVRSDHWKRFDAGVDDFCARHRGVYATAKLKDLLADAYRAAIANDEQGFNRILGID